MYLITDSQGEVRGVYTAGHLEQACKDLVEEIEATFAWELRGHNRIQMVVIDHYHEHCTVLRPLLRAMIDGVTPLDAMGGYSIVEVLQTNEMA